MKWGEQATTDEDTIRRWWSMWPASNVGVATGGGIAVLDVDPRHGGDGTLERLESERGSLPETEKIATGGGGFHYIFRAPVGTRSHDLAPGVELKAEGTFVVAPPSMHASGRAYTLLGGEPADAPGWLLAGVDGARNGTAPAIEGDIIEGERHNALVRIAGAMRRQGAGEQEILTALRETNRLRCKPPGDYESIRQIAADIAGRYEAAPVEESEKAEKVTGDTWQPENLAEVIAGGRSTDPPVALRRNDGVALLYAGRIHAFNGEPEVGKGWLALLACAERLAAGDDVLYIDFEDSSTEIVPRLLALGTDPETILQRFHYVRPDEPYGQEARERLAAVPTPALIVIDGLTEALALEGLNPLDNSEYAKWLGLLARPFKRDGATVVLLDHVTKDKEQRGRFALGAQHKLAGIDVGFRLDAVEAFGRGREGLSRVTLTKDRPGWLGQSAAEGRRIATLRLISHTNERVTAELEPVAEGQGGGFRPTGVMERVSKLVELEPGLSRNGIRDSVGGKSKYVDLALELLSAEGYVEVRADGQARRHHSRRPFREAENDQPGPRDPTGTQPGPGPGETNRDPGPLPIRGPGPGPSHASQNPPNRDPGPKQGAASEERVPGYDFSRGELEAEAKRQRRLSGGEL